MIGKLIKGAGARGLFSYLLGSHDMNGDIRPRSQLIGGTFAGSNVHELSAEFGQLRALKPRLAKAVAHQCLRLPEGDPIPDDATWSRIADRWASEMGFQSYVVVSHGDHIHIGASRINPDGSVVSDSHDWRRSEIAIRQIEMEFGLTQIESSHLLEPERATTHRKAPTRGQIEMAARGEIPPSAIISEMIDSKLKDGCTAAELVEHLEANGITVRPNIASSGKVSGMTYELDSVEVSAKAMGRGFTWSNLQKRGMTYVEDRDLQSLRSAGYRATNPELGSPDISLARDDGAHRPAPRILEQDAGKTGVENPARSRGAGRDGQDDQHHVGPASRSRHPDAEGQGRDLSDRRNDPVPSQPAQGRSRHGDAAAARPEPQGPLENRPDDRSNGGNVEPGGDLEQLVLLAVTASRDRSASAGRDAPNRPADKGLAQLKLRATEIVDRTRRAVSSYLEALPAASYRLQLVRPDQPNVNLPGQSPDQVLNSIAWLKSQNARGADVYIRPEDRRYILLDDINGKTVDRLTADGMAPAAVLETSRGNLAAWVRIAPPDAPEPSPEAATTIAKALARTYAADTAAADHAHVSRLPGFTNRKPIRQVEGRSPYVLLKSASGRIAEAGLDLIDQVRVYLEKNARQRAIVISDDRPRSGDPADAYRTFMRRHTAGDKVDWSQADFRAAQDMILTGWSRDQVAQAIEEASPNVIERKGQQTPDYAARTAHNALQSDLVQVELRRRVIEEKARQEREKREALEAARNTLKPRGYGR